MPALTIKNIPDDVYLTLKQTAEIHRRSINSEVIFYLENALMPKKRLTPTEQLARVESLRSAIQANVITADEISSAVVNAPLIVVNTNIVSYFYLPKDYSQSVSQFYQHDSVWIAPFRCWH